MGRPRASNFLSCHTTEEKFGWFCSSVIANHTGHFKATFRPVKLSPEHSCVLNIMRDNGLTPSAIADHLNYYYGLQVSRIQVQWSFNVVLHLNTLIDRK